MTTPGQIADGRLKPAAGEPWTEGTFTLYLGSRTVYNISAEHADVLREAMIRAVEADRAQRPAPVPGPEARIREFLDYLPDDLDLIAEGGDDPGAPMLTASDLRDLLGEVESRRP